MTWSLDPKLRSILVCPKCRGDLEDIDEGLLCRHDALLFPVVDSVPMMILELARPYPLNQTGRTGD